jgi:hypothetical protein
MIRFRSLSGVFTWRDLHVHPVWLDPIRPDEAYQAVNINAARFNDLDEHEAL